MTNGSGQGVVLVAKSSLSLLALSKREPQVSFKKGTARRSECVILKQCIRRLHATKGTQ